MVKTIKLVMLLLLAALLLGACTKAKEPEQKPQTFVVPEVSTIPFETIDLKDAPLVVKKMAHSMSEQDFITWTSVNDDGYVIVYPGFTNKNGPLEIDKIEQRIPDDNHSWLNVKLKYSSQQSEKQTEPIVAKFTLTNAPEAMGFQLANNKKEKIPKEPPVKQENKQEKNNEQNESQNEVNLDLENVQPEAEAENQVEIMSGPALRITGPAPAEAVSNPVKITGVIALKNGRVTVRIKDDLGQVLAEKPLKVDGTEFETTLSFTPPGKQQQGFIEAILIDNEDNAEISRVSVGVTLMP
ncbi:MAG: hypothetical protein FH758_00540 [Firmicutes bacterium]|nr:hypothetical protein [Bacillota bacterium]